jgi:D-glycero-D-manno-heptose 1,7-bisphosphate phosphatase
VSGTATSDRIIVLDRDGTLVVDRGYLDDPAGLEFEPYAAEALRCWSGNGYRLLVITNQSGVGRGFFPAERVEAMNARLQAMVAECGARLEAIYYCPHLPEAGCNCRKPALGLLRQAASELGFRPELAVVIGDKTSDIEFGQRAGAKTVLISAGPPPAMRISPDLILPNLLDAARAVIARGW